MIKIDKNIPCPPRRSGNDVYPFRQMAIGDSFYLPLSGGVRAWRIK